MMTGDGNLIEMQARPSAYTISDPPVYLFEADDVPGVLHGSRRIGAAQV